MTHFLTVQNETFTQFVVTILCAIGSVLAVIICTAFMMHILYNSRYQTGEQANKRMSKSTIIANSMVNLYLITSILTCAIYGFVRSNVFTFIPLSAFSDYQCAIGYSAGFFLTSFNRMCLYFLFLYRIRSVFENSAYEYSSKTFQYLKTALILGYLAIIIAALLMFTHSNGFTLFYDESTGFIWCGHQSYRNNVGSLRRVLVAWYICIVVAEIVVNLTFLFMFSKGLYSLQYSMIKRHLSLRVAAGIPMTPSLPVRVPDTSGDCSVYADAVQRQMDDKSTSPRRSSLSPQELSRMVSFSPRGSVVSSFHEMMANYTERKANTPETKDASIEMLIKLHQLVKKTTILVCIAIGSSFMYWILSAINGWFAILVSWDILINSVCAWLMLNVSLKYWNCCVTYGVCRCCYKELDDVML